MTDEGEPDQPSDATSDPHNLPLVLIAVIAGLIALGAMFWALSQK